MSMSQANVNRFSKRCANGRPLVYEIMMLFAYKQGTPLICLILLVAESANAYGPNDSRSLRRLIEACDFAELPFSAKNVAAFLGTTEVMVKKDALGTIFYVGPAGSLLIVTPANKIYRGSIENVYVHYRHHKKNLNIGIKLQSKAVQLRHLIEATADEVEIDLSEYCLSRFRPVSKDDI